MSTSAKKSDDINPFKGNIVTTISLLIPAVIYGFPALLIYLLISNVASFDVLRIIAWVVSPMLYSILFILTAGLISLPTHKGIIAGKFPRSPGHSIYSYRKIYGTCWTTVFYCKPIYFLLLTLPLFKRIGLRLFGYKGALNFVTYPDTWMRDLPLLRIEEGAYLSNRSTIGTNMCLVDGNIVVGGVWLKKGSMVGHLTMVAPGSELGCNSEISVGCAIGINAKIGDNTDIGPSTTIFHFARVGNNVKIGAHSFIGAGAVIGDGIKLPNGAMIPDRAKVLSQEDAKKYISSISTPYVPEPMSMAI